MASTLPETPAPAATARHGRPWRAAARALTIAAVVAAALAGGYLALVSYSQVRTLSVGEIRLSVSPGHRGALDVYVPLVDWGARFESIRFPVRLRVDVRTVDREQLQRLADGAELDVDAVRDEARDAIAAFLRALIAVVTVCALALGLLTAFAVRHRVGPGLRYTVAAACVAALGLAVAMVVLIPPRGQIDTPQYYAYGADIPRALDAVSTVRRSGAALDQELDAQLVGLARLVTDPANRTPVEGAPRATIASDLHNNVISLPILERTAGDGPVLFPGDLSDRGSPLETALVARVAEIGRPFVFVTGNHDSDRSAQELADDGAVVLTQFGRLKRGGGYGPVINEIAGMRVAGYSDPFQRREAENFRDRFEPEPTPAQLEAFAAWLRQLVGKVDVVMVHQPELIAKAVDELDVLPPERPLVFVVGHTHKPDLTRVNEQVTIVNGGSIGGGGTGNLADEETTDIGLARLSYSVTGGFQPLAADLVGIDPGSGAATARRDRLDEPPTG
jgi:predicted phosphodiesterase